MEKSNDEHILKILFEKYNYFQGEIDHIDRVVNVYMSEIEGQLERDGKTDLLNDLIHIFDGVRTISRLAELLEI